MPAVGNDHWNTPKRIVDLLWAFWGGPPILDPCSNTTSIVGAVNEWYGPPTGTNGLIMPWTAVPHFSSHIDLLSAFVNCPYSQKAPWMKKCHDESRAGVDEIIALIPADTDTAHGHDHCVPATRRCLLRGRLVHTGVKSKPEPARFPSALVYWQHQRNPARIARFHEVFAPEGWVA